MLPGIKPKRLVTIVPVAQMCSYDAKDIHLDKPQALAKLASLSLSLRRCSESAAPRGTSWHAVFGVVLHKPLLVCLMSAAFVAIKDPVEASTLTGSQLLTCGFVIIPGPFSDRQKCWDGSEKKSEWKRMSPQIWQRWAFVRSIYFFLVW